MRTVSNSFRFYSIEHIDQCPEETVSNLLAACKLTSSQWMEFVQYTRMKNEARQFQRLKPSIFQKQ